MRLSGLFVFIRPSEHSGFSYRKRRALAAELILISEPLKRRIAPGVSTGAIRQTGQVLARIKDNIVAMEIELNKWKKK